MCIYYKMQGNSPRNKVHNINSGDSINFYNAFLRRYNADGSNIIEESPESNATNSLFVIDVQDDFILPPPGLKFLPKGYKFGRFNVEDGANMTQALGAFIVANMDKFTKVIFSRDTHTTNHCSFGSSGGPFPNHCIANHIGSKFHDHIKLPEIMSQNTNKVDVIFKGCSHTTDSFGAVKYKDDDYGKERQLGPCSLEGGFTGGKYLINKERNFDDYPFDPANIPQYTVNEDITCGKSTTENIAKELGADFEIETLFQGQTQGTHNIYVVGVAGDFCVKDTAMNIMKSLPADKTLNGVKINVYILQPFVRYGFLPIQFLGGFNNVYKSRAVVKRTNYTNIKEGKDINQYVFKYDGANKKLLTQDEIVKKQKYINSILTFKDALELYDFNPDNVKNPGNVKNALNSAGITNPEVLCSFLSPVKDIIRDYRNTGVKILLTMPTDFTSISTGGARHKNRSKRITRRIRRKGRKTRGRKMVMRGGLVHTGRKCYSAGAGRAVDIGCKAGFRYHQGIKNEGDICTECGCTNNLKEILNIFYPSQP